MAATACLMQPTQTVIGREIAPIRSDAIYKCAFSPLSCKEGVVTSFSPEKGFGLIEMSSGAEIFFHWRDQMNWSTVDGGVLFCRSKNDRVSKPRREDRVIFLVKPRKGKDGFESFMARPWALLNDSPQILWIQWIHQAGPYFVEESRKRSTNNRPRDGYHPPKRVQKNFRAGKGVRVDGKKARKD